MNDLINQIVEKAGIPADKTQQVLDVVAGFVEQKFPQFGRQIDSVLGTTGGTTEEEAAVIPWEISAANLVFKEIIPPPAGFWFRYIGLWFSVLSMLSKIDQRSLKSCTKFRLIHIQTAKSSKQCVENLTPALSTRGGEGGIGLPQPSLIWRVIIIFKSVFNRRTQKKALKQMSASMIFLNYVGFSPSGVERGEVRFNYIPWNYHSSNICNKYHCE